MRRGRKARLEKPPEQSAVAPGLTGGRFKPLTEAEIQNIHHTILDVLENIGMADPIPIVQEQALRKGCTIDDHGRLCFPRALVEDMIADAAKELTFYGQDPRFDLDLRDQRVHTYGGGEAVTILDMGASTYRPSTLMDVYDAARLVDRLDNIHAFSRLMVATDMQGRLACDINTAYVSAAGTAKHTALTFGDAKNVEPTLEMLYMIAGGKDKFHERPFCHGGGCPVISPLRYGADNSEVCVESVKFGAPVWIVVAPQAGATAPAALAGAVVQVMAEAIASLLMINFVAPGYPVIVGPWPFVSDLRTGSFTGGGGEEALVSAAAAQMTNHYGLVSSVGAGMTDSKLPDNQAGYEKAIAVALAALAGCNNISESAGMMGSLMGLSFESLVIDNDMLGTVLRTVRGIEVNEETLSYAEIENAVRGEGHFLRQKQTLSLMRSEYDYPKLADRLTPNVWEEAGSLDIREQAAMRVNEILSTHYPTYIDPAVDNKIRDRFKIKIPPEHMQPGSGRW
ncbi:MAG: trimethylamine methyltransferase family protein [Gammaproteobacteria bacterium]|nr:trimethylamine methyltransferase family protein [Gammaproteobacteria bacterium]